MAACLEQDLFDPVDSHARIAGPCFAGSDNRSARIDQPRARLAAAHVETEIISRHNRPA
jgi:hypothetical protein